MCLGLSTALCGTGAKPSEPMKRPERWCPKAETQENDPCGSDKILQPRLSLQPPAGTAEARLIGGFAGVGKTNPRFFRSWWGRLRLQLT